MQLGAGSQVLRKTNSWNPAPNTNMSDSSRELSLVEGLDYYIENGFMVFTAAYLLKRGYCCHHGCRHCPYGESTTDAQQKLESEKNDKN